MVLLANTDNLIRVTSNLRKGHLTTLLEDRPLRANLRISNRHTPTTLLRANLRSANINIPPSSILAAPLKLRVNTLQPNPDNTRTNLTHLNNHINNHLKDSTDNHRRNTDNTPQTPTKLATLRPQRHTLPNSMELL